MLHWGLIPSWAKERSIGSRMINARGETVAEKPSFRTALRRRRCLIVTDGYYEWQKIGGPKQPYYYHRPDSGVFAFAGLWESWRDKATDETVESCTIITTEANAQAAEIHDRMPVILMPEEYDRWLDRKNEDAATVADLIRPGPEDFLSVYPVSTFVNRPTNDEAACIAAR